MEKMNDLRDLLKHEVMDLYSAESQIIDALPSMIDKAKNTDLKKVLQNHLKVTEKQRSRLEQVQNLLGGEEQNTGDNSGLFSRLFKGRQVCRGMQGIIEEGSKVMKEDMDSDVMDAAIIGCAQKVEHYEICGYGTARTFARELNLEQVAQLLEQTLDEEYQADDTLTQLAVSHINKQAQSSRSKSSTGSQMQGRTSGSRSTTQERARRMEPEMEMASNRNRSNTTASRTTSTGRGSTTPRGTASRSTVASNRNTASTRRNTTNAANSRTESRTTRGSSSGRGTSSGRSR